MLVKIRSYLWQGDIDSAINAGHTDDIDIVIYLGKHMPVQMERFRKPVIHMSMHDGEENPEKLRLINSVITHVGGFSWDWGKRVLVACHAGMSRSPTMVLYHLVSAGVPFDEAERHIMEKNPAWLPEPSLYVQVKRMVVGE